VADEKRVTIASDADIVTARQQGRTVAAEMGFQATDLALIATAISELARNIVRYAGCGEIQLTLLNDGNKRGLQVVASDSGPGIPDIDRALESGYSTSGSLGLGLPGVRRLMDDMEIHSEVGKGTTVKARKWRR